MQRLWIIAAIFLTLSLSAMAAPKPICIDNAAGLKAEDDYCSLTDPCGGYLIVDAEATRGNIIWCNPDDNLLDLTQQFQRTGKAGEVAFTTDPEFTDVLEVCDAAGDTCIYLDCSGGTFCEVRQEGQSTELTRIENDQGQIRLEPCTVGPCAGTTDEVIAVAEKLHIGLDTAADVQIVFDLDTDRYITWDESDNWLESSADWWVDGTIWAGAGNLRATNSLYLTEQAAAGGDTAGDGQLWVKDDAPNTAWFTDDDGTDFQLGAAAPGGNDTEVQFNDGGVFGGDSQFTFNKTTGVVTLTSGTDPTLDISAGSVRAKYIGVNIAPSVTYDLYLAANSQIYTRGYLAVGNYTPVTDRRAYFAWSSTGNSTKHGVYGLVVNNQSSLSNYSSSGVSCDSRLATSSTAGLVYGGNFSARAAMSTAVDSAAGGIIGGRFTANYYSGTGSFSAQTQIMGGKFVIDIGGGSSITWGNADAAFSLLDVAGTNNTLTTGNGFTFGQMLGAGTAPAITTARGVYLATQTAALAPTVTNLYGLYMEDWTDMNTTVLQAIWIEPQDGANKAATKGNIYMDGDGFDEGHSQWNTGHLWSTSGVIRMQGSAPTIDTDAGLHVGDDALSFYDVTTPIAQPSSTGETAGFTAVGGTNVDHQDTFTGNVGATAYTINDIVKHLKNLGLIDQ